MGSNVEIKARADNFQALETIAEQLSGSPGQLIEQEDTFFNVPKGRLKLRTFTPSRGELIYYERGDIEGPTQSQYTITETNAPLSLKSTLASALGVRGIVRKKRLLFLVGQTRIHLDEVEGLGHFVELEVVLQPGQSPEEATRIARDLKAKLGIRDEDLVAMAYIDLLVDEEAE